MELGLRAVQNLTNVYLSYVLRMLDMTHQLNTYGCLIEFQFFEQIFPKLMFWVIIALSFQPISEACSLFEWILLVQWNLNIIFLHLI